MEAQYFKGPYSSNLSSNKQTLDNINLLGHHVVFRWHINSTQNHHQNRMKRY